MKRIGRIFRERPESQISSAGINDLLMGQFDG